MSARRALLLLPLAAVLLLGGWTAPPRWTSLSTLTALEVFDRQAPDGLYRVGDHLAEAEPQLEPAMLAHAAGVFRSLYDGGLRQAGGRTWLAVIPGKHAFLAGDRPALDCQALAAALTDQAPFLEAIDLTGVLSLENYYRTDVHWRQETLLPVARHLAGAMGAAFPEADWTRQTVLEDFRGGYLRRTGLPLPAEPLRCLTGSVPDGCAVTCADLMGRARPGVVYDRERAWGREPYDLFLSGPQGLMTLENPRAATDRELLLFRDSFGSSLAPLLAASYAKITLVDLRYLPSHLVGQYVDLHGQDTLFLYSSLLLNNSLSLR